MCARTIAVAGVCMLAIGCAGLSRGATGPDAAAGRPDVARRAAMLQEVATNVAAARAAKPPAGVLLPPPPPSAVPIAWQQAPAVRLWPGEPPGGPFVPVTPPAGWPPTFVLNVRTPELRVFRPKTPNGRALLAVPGGGYLFVSIANEGAELAARFNELGYTVFVLVYRLPSEGWNDGASVPLQDAQRAMRVLRARAGEWRIDSERIAVLGFSAGGHVAATLATGFDERTYEPVDAADAGSARPHAAGLVYPVVTMDAAKTHAGSRELLLGAHPSAEAIAARSGERHVRADTPPMFLVHAMDDAAVPVDNSLDMGEALRAARRPVELHLYGEGGHAFGLGYPAGGTRLWTELFDAWLKRQK